MSADVFILGGKRTPMGEYVGALKDVSAIELGAIASRAALEESGVAPEKIDHTIMGNALQTSGDAIYGARHVALKAGVPFDRPALRLAARDLRHLPLDPRGGLERPRAVLGAGLPGDDGHHSASSPDRRASSKRSSPAESSPTSSPTRPRHTTS